MSSIDEKRVYSAREGKTDVFVATEVGVARVECSGDLVGGFGLVHRCAATDIAAEGGRLAVATDEDVLVWNGDGFAPTDFGPATAVGYHDGVVAAGPDRIAKYAADEWQVLDADGIAVRAIDGGLIAAASGVYRLPQSTGGTRLTSVGLDDARDVSSTGVPLVATGDGLYQLKNGWVNVLDGEIHCIEHGERQAHAATDDALYTRSRESDEWERVGIPVEQQITGIGYGESGSIYAVTTDGTFLLSTSEDTGWQRHSLGLPDVCGLVVPSHERKPV